MKNFWLVAQSEIGIIASALFESLPVSRLVSLIFISAVLGIVFVYLYSFVSFQAALGKIKKKITAAALEPFLFKDNLLLSVSSPVRIFVLGFKYLALCLPPLVVLAVPMLWLLGFINQGYGYRVLGKGDKVFVTITAESSRDIRTLEVASELKGAILTELVKAPLQNKAFAELRVESPGPDGQLKIINKTSDISIKLAGSKYGIPVYTSDALNKLIFPGAGDKLPEGIKEIEFQYPANYFQESLGFPIHWLILFLVVSVISGLMFAKYSGIEV